MEGLSDTDRRYYECIDCRTRIVAETFEATCPDCAGRLRNIAVPRE